MEAEEGIKAAQSCQCGYLQRGGIGFFMLFIT